MGFAKRIFCILLLAMLVAWPTISMAKPKQKSADVEEIIALAREGDKIKENLVSLDGAIEDSKANLKRSREIARKSKKLLQVYQKELKTKQKLFKQAKQQLEIQTIQYVSLANSLGGKVFDGDQNLLAYAADASSQDAVLVYETTRSLLDTKRKHLGNIRDYAQKTAFAQQSVNKKLVAQNLALKQKQKAIQSEKTYLKALRKSSQKALKDYKKYRKVEKQYARQFFRETGQQGNLEDSPFSDNMLSDPSIEAKIKWPLQGRVSSNFSKNRCLQGTCRPHEGIDIAVAVNTPVYASARGRVSFAGIQSGYGNIVCIDHGGGLESCYAHLSSIEVKQSQNVKQDKEIAKSGCTGRCFGPHLHYEIRTNGKATDPLKFLPALS